MALRHMIRTRHLNGSYASKVIWKGLEALFTKNIINQVKHCPIITCMGVQANKTALSCWPHPQKAYHAFYFAHQKRGIAHAIYNVEELERFYYDVELPGCFANQEHLATKQGWAIMKDPETGDITLFNYDSMESIHVPAPPPLPPPMREARWLTVGANITAAPTKKNCILVLFYHDYPFIKFCYLRDKEWFVKKYDMPNYGLRNVLVTHGNIYGSTMAFRLVKIVLSKRKFSINYVTGMELYPLSGENICWFVESEGELYNVEMVYRRRFELPTIEGFGVYKLNSSEMCLEEVKSIGETVFCLDVGGHNNNISCVAKNVGLTKDCIHYKIENHSYRYNLTNRGITLLLSTDEDGYILPQCLKSTILDDSLTLMQVHNQSQLSDLDTREVTVSSVIEVDQRDLKLLLDQNSPCLLSFSNDYTSINLIDPVHNVRQSIPSPDIPPFNKILSSKFGWLLLMTREDGREDGRNNIFFYNPLTKRIIDLPPFEFCHFDPPIENCHFFRFSFSHPPTSNNCTVAAVLIEFHCSFGEFYKERRNLYVVTWKKGENNWTDIEFIYDDEKFEPLKTVPVFHREKVYFMGANGVVGVFDPIMRSCTLLHNSKENVDGSSRNYLVESNGDLFWVHTTFIGDAVCVYKFDHSSTKWKKVSNLGGRCLFLGTNSSIITRMEGMEERIYFPMFWNNSFVYYSLKEGTMFPTENFYGVEELSIGSCWIEPNTVQRNCTKKIDLDNL